MNDLNNNSVSMNNNPSSSQKAPLREVLGDTSSPSLRGRDGERQTPLLRGGDGGRLLTIIIPTYNMEKYLRHCLDSLIVPNMDKVEVLVINDGSKDSSSAIAHEYQDKYPQTFRVIDKENGNYGSCINRGLKEATGKYIKVLDADDSFETDNFRKYIDYLDSVDVDLVLNDFVMVKPDGTVESLWKGHNLPTDKPFDFNRLGANCNMWMHAVAYKTSNIRQIRGGV